MLNSEQQKAVLASKGKVLVLAGAGSGKTTVLACRIAHLIQNESVPPSAILGLTFTNKAAEEMRERVKRFTNAKVAKEVTLCTFHSFCMNVLRQEIHHLGFTPEFTLYDEKDVKRVLTQIVRHALEHEGDLPSLQSTLEKITQAKNQGLDALEEEEKTSSWHASFSKDLLEKLHLCMRSYNAVDFDSLLTLTVSLFEEHPAILDRFQERFKYIMIDEYQDTNPVQYKLAELLSKKYGNLCVVGDDDQSIYGWRGAEVKHILHFPAETTVKLEQNYRSTPTILQAANQVISHNVERHDKKLWSQTAESEPLFLFHAPNEIEEAQSVVQRILYLKKHKNLEWKDMAILYRSNALSQSFETALLQAAWEENGLWKRGIPYEVFGGTEFYERAEIKDTLAYLRVLANPLDQEALLRILNVPRRGISDNCLDLLTQYNRKNDISLWEVLQSVHQGISPLQDSLSTKAISGINQFCSLFKQAKELTGVSLSETLQWIIREVDYKKAIREDVKSEKMREFKWDNVSQCVEALSLYEGKMEEKASLQDFLSSTLLSSHDHPKSTKQQQENKVHLMTVHSSKGLEFEACFLVCLEDHIMPHEKSLKESGLEEERRLMYVAMTRAKKYLTLSMARDRKKMGKQIQTTPSRFLFEIPKEILKITSYQTVEM
jgi:DNA helicase-2/ATP-dependent DNA helicase PcrA